MVVFAEIMSGREIEFPAIRFLAISRLPPPPKNNVKMYCKSRLIVSPSSTGSVVYGTHSRVARIFILRTPLRARNPGETF